MSEPDILLPANAADPAETGPEDEPTAAAEPAVADSDRPELADGPDPADPDNPWHGIPGQLLDGTYSYDQDSAGGCG